jgi:hypothetical protein
MGAVIAAGAVALGVAMTVTAPAAHAERLSENTIKSDCKAAGGTYQTESHGRNNRVSSCTYKDYYGDTYEDFYHNGEYNGTDGPI